MLQPQLIYSVHETQRSSLLSKCNCAVHTVYMYMLQEASEPSSTSVDNHAEPFRAALDRSVQAYIKDHYPNGVVTVSVMVYHYRHASTSELKKIQGAELSACIAHTLLKCKTHYNEMYM